MGELNLKFVTTLDATSRDVRLDVPIDLTASEAEAIKRHVDELVNSRQPNETHLQEIRDICARHSCDLCDIRSPMRRQRDTIVAARYAIIRYLLSQDFSYFAVADFVHRDVSTLHNMRAKLHG